MGPETEQWVEDVEKKQGAPVDRQLVARKGAKSRRRVIGRNHSFRVAAEGGMPPGLSLVTFATET